MFLAQNFQNIESIPLSLEFYGGASYTVSDPKDFSKKIENYISYDYFKAQNELFLRFLAQNCQNFEFIPLSQRFYGEIGYTGSDCKGSSKNLKNYVPYNYFQAQNGLFLRFLAQNWVMA